MIISAFDNSDYRAIQLSKIARYPSGKIAASSTSDKTAKEIYNLAPAIIYNHTIPSNTQVVCNIASTGSYNPPYQLHGVFDDITIELPNEYKYLPSVFCFYIDKMNVRGTNWWTRVSGENYSPDTVHALIKQSYNWENMQEENVPNNLYPNGGPYSGAISYDSDEENQYKFIGYVPQSGVAADPRFRSGNPSIRFQLILRTEGSNSSLEGKSVTYKSNNSFNFTIKIYPCYTLF